MATSEGTKCSYGTSVVWNTLLLVSCYLSNPTQSWELHRSFSSKGCDWRILMFTASWQGCSSRGWALAITLGTRKGDFGEMDVRWQWKQMDESKHSLSKTHTHFFKSYSDNIAPRKASRNMVSYCQQAEFHKQLGLCLTITRLASLIPFLHFEFPSWGGGGWLVICRWE